MRIEYHQPTAKVHLVTDHGLIHEIPCEVLQIAQQQFGKVLLDVRLTVEPVERFTEAIFRSFVHAVETEATRIVAQYNRAVEEEHKRFDIDVSSLTAATEAKLDNPGSDVSSNSAASADVGGVPGSGAAEDDSQGVQK